MTLCNFADECIAAVENRNRRPARATHLVVTARTDTNAAADSYRLCTDCAKRFVGGSIEVNNGPQSITVVRLR